LETARTKGENPTIKSLWKSIHT